MAKATKDGGVNKSEAIREILATDPTMTAGEVVAALKQRGIKASANLIYLVRTKARAKRRRAKRQQAVANGAAMGIANPVDLILEVRQLSARAGGIRHLKKLVDVLAE
jgi:hypothetical protein